MKLNVEEIKIIMAEKNMNYSELAQRLEMARPTISTILSRGTANIKTTGKIAKVLGVPVKDIIISTSDEALKQ